MKTSALITALAAFALIFSITSCDVNANSKITTSETWSAVEGGSKSGTADSGYSIKMQNGRLYYNGEDYGACSEGASIKIDISRSNNNGTKSSDIEIYRNGSKIVKTPIH